MQLSNKPWKQNNGEQISSSPTRTTAATQTGIPDLDKLLSSRQLDVSAKKLADFISKRKTDRRTVWQGLPGILSTIFGGGIGNNKHSWLDAIRAGKRPNIRSVTAIGIYCGTNPNELERIVNKASNARPSECGELNDAMFWRRSKNKNYKMIPHHSMTLSLATQERRSQLSDCSLFNVIFNTTMNPEYCTYQYDTNQLPNGVKHIIISKLRGDNVILHDPYDVYTDILERTAIDNQNRYEGEQGGNGLRSGALQLILTPGEYLLFSFFHYPVSTLRGNPIRNYFQRGIVNNKSKKPTATNKGNSNSRINYSSSTSDFNTFGINNNNNNSSNKYGVTTINKSSSSSFSSSSSSWGIANNFTNKFGSKHNSAQDKRNSPTYLAYAPLRELVHDDPYMLLVHQYCEFFMPLEYLAPTHEEQQFVNYLVQFWLKQTLRVRTDMSRLTGYTDQNSNSGGGGGSTGGPSSFKPTGEQVIGLLVFITHVHIRDRPSLYQENPSMPVEPVSDDVYDEHLKCGTSHTMHRIQSPMYDFFCSALVESSHRKTVPVFSMVVDLWLAYCQPWHAVKRTCEKPRIAGQSKSRLGIDVNAANRTGSSRESHSNNKNKRKNKNNKAGVRRDAWARRSARENDPVTREWLSYVVHNYFFYVEMLTIVMSRSYKFDYSRHGTGELDLMERVLAMYTPNLRSILNQCRLYLNISLLHPHDDLSIQAKEELQQLQSNGRLFVGSGFANVLKMQYSKIEPNDIHKIHLRMPTMGKDSIQFITNELQNINDQKKSNSSSFTTTMRQYFHGKKGVLSHTEPLRDQNGFITNVGREQLLDRTCSAVYWNNQYGPSTQNIFTTRQHPCSFMKEVYSKQRSVLRLIPEDSMVSPVTRYEIRPFVWVLVYISQTINGWWGLTRVWEEYIHVSGDGCEDEGRWFPVDVEGTVGSLKQRLQKKYGIAVEDQQLLIRNGGEGEEEGEEDWELDDDDRFVDYSLHHGNKLRLVDLSNEDVGVGGIGEGKGKGKGEDGVKKKNAVPGGKKSPGGKNQKNQKNKAVVAKEEDMEGGEREEDMVEEEDPYHVLGPWGEELPRGAWGSTGSGNKAQDLSAWVLNAKQENLNFEPRMNRIQRMIYVLCRVTAIKQPARVTEHSKKTNAKSDNKNKASPKQQKEQGIKKCPQPKWTVYKALPGIERVNLRFFAGWWNLLFTLLCCLLLYWKYFQMGEGDGRGAKMGGYKKYRDPTRL